LEVRTGAIRTARHSNPARTIDLWRPGSRFSASVETSAVQAVRAHQRDHHHQPGLRRGGERLRRSAR
jgi:hypothetical protein